MSAGSAKQMTRAGSAGAVGVFVVDSITATTPEARGQVVVTGSHGGVNMCTYAAAAGVRAALFNDAGVGKDQAGIAGLRFAERFRLAAAAVDYRSAGIGLGPETLRFGRVSAVNRWAEEVGVRLGMKAEEAATLMARWDAGGQSASPESPASDPPLLISPGPPAIAAFDSVTQIDASHSGWIVITASHPGLIEGEAVRFNVAGAFFNDAGGGKDATGLGRLAALERKGTPAGAVSHWSARIGDAPDAYRNGVLSALNRPALELGLRPGQRLRAAVGHLQKALAEPV